jgi:hypothetical protein
LSDSASAASAAAATTANCANPTSPIPAIFPASSSVVRTRDSTTSTTRLDFSSTTPTSRKLP